VPTLSPDLWGLYVPTWILAVATTGALVAAALAAFFTGRSLKLERGREAALERERRVSQARLVTAWLAVDDNWNPRGQGPLTTDGLTHQNGSYQPITEVAIALSLNNFEYWIKEIKLVPPGFDTVFQQPGGMSYGPLVISPINSPQRYLSLSEVSDVEVDLRFTDSAGVQWRRTATALVDLGASLEVRRSKSKAGALLVVLKRWINRPSG